MTAYYNEIDPFAAQWLRTLIAEGHIAPGIVDERDIRDVTPAELTQYTQCHFFAGIGVWSYALRRAGWPDDAPVWTGSCPCQPFSSAGRRAGIADERHLWPAWFHLISQCKPPVVFGEQVASKDGLGWLDLVQADLEAADYACGPVDLCAAGVGAPHIRQRLWFVAERLGHHHHPGLEGQRGRHSAAQGHRPAALRPAAEAGEPGRLADAESERRDRGESSTGQAGRLGLEDGSDAHWPGPTNGFWRDADWLGCRDGKWRPVEPSPQQMADGSADCVGRVCAEGIAKAEEEIDEWAYRHSTDAGKALRDLWNELSAEAIGERTVRGPWGLFEAPVLLAFLRQLSEQGWKFSYAFSCASAGASGTVLRALRIDREAACSPRGRELEEQRTGEPADPLRELSQVLARNAESAWGETCRAYAGRGFPLAKNALARVGRLRGYGNAINAEAATALIASYREARNV